MDVETFDSDKRVVAVATGEWAAEASSELGGSKQFYGKHAIPKRGE